MIQRTVLMRYWMVETTGTTMLTLIVGVIVDIGR